MRGKMSFLMKGIYFIIILVVISIVINQIISMNLISVRELESINLRDRSRNILETLTGNKNCLAYEEVGSVEGKDVLLNSHKIIDLNKLEEFSSNFDELEPDCVRDFNFGYRVKVKTFPVNISTLGPETINIEIESDIWTFGDREFSEDESLEEMIRVSIPVVVRYDQSAFLPGMMSITLVNGELERLAGFIEESCFTEKESTLTLHLNYPVELKGNKICMKFKSGDKCQKLACEKTIEFHEIERPGNYKFYSRYEDEILKILV